MRDGYWYPLPRLPEDTDPGDLLADYELVTDRIEGFELVAGLEAVGGGTGEAGGRLRWQNPFPLEGLVLLGGPLERHTRVHDGITLHAVVAPGKGGQLRRPRAGRRRGRGAQAAPHLLQTS